MKTLLILAGEPLGISTDSLSPGDIIKIGSEKSKPVVVNHIIQMPMDINSEGKLIPKYQVDADMVAYLHIDERIEKQYTNKSRSSKMEKVMAKTVRGKTTVGSGAFAFHKGDVKSDIWLGEHKFTDALFYSLTTKVWKKIGEEAFGVQKRPLMEIVLGADTLGTRLMVLSLKDFGIESGASEEELSDAFYFKFLTSKFQSIRLNAPDIEAHFNLVEKKFPTKLPGVILTFGGLSLIAMKPADFQRVFDE